MTATTNRLHGAVEEAVESVLDRCEHYANYMRQISPVTPHDVFRRYLFAYCTVNLSWESSVRLYTLLGALHWPASEADIRAAFIEARAGFQETRPRYIADFSGRYFHGLASYIKFTYRPGTSWTSWRHGLEKRILGLGRVKISFSMELIYPESTEIVCLDRHMLGRVFHQDPSAGISESTYMHCEKRWVDCCRHYHVAPGIARLAYWDWMQGREDPDYWAFVFKQHKEAVCLK